MESDNPAKHFVLAFLIALLGYFLVYHGIEYRRTRKGPWIVSFTNSHLGEPSIIINQPTLRLTNAQIVFTGASSPPITNYPALDFSQPRPVPFEVPFGKCIFMDTTFLPGTLTFQFFGHEIEFLPRVLIIDHEEHTWNSEQIVTLKVKLNGTK